MRCMDELMPKIQRKNRKNQLSVVYKSQQSTKRIQKYTIISLTKPGNCDIMKSNCDTKKYLK